MINKFFKLNAVTKNCKIRYKECNWQSNLVKFNFKNKSNLAKY